MFFFLSCKPSHCQTTHAAPVLLSVYLIYLITHTHAEIKKTARLHYPFFLIVIVPQTTIEFLAGVGRVTVFPYFCSHLRINSN